MFASQQKSTGTQYAVTVALLTLALIFSPALLAMSRPFGRISVMVALASSALCVTLARFHWKKHSELTIPSLECPVDRAK